MKYSQPPIRSMARQVWKVSIMATFAVIVSAQGPPFGGPEGRGRPPGRHGSDDTDVRSQGPLATYAGKWWTDPFIVRRLNLTAEQQRRIEDVFQQSRLKLIDLTAALEKEEAILEPLLATEHLSESAALSQVDRVADARAALEKANSRMLVAFRTALTLDQWTALQSPDRNRMPGRGGPPGRGR